jgi:penicillin-binding protein 1A
MRWLGSFILWMMSLGFVAVFLATGLVFWYLGYISRDLPDYRALKDYQPPVVTRVHTGDGRLMAEFATERRVFVPIEEIPPLVIKAFLSAEDKNFYEHKGVDMWAIGRAVVSNLKHAGSGRRAVGASTITQQVAKNFLLTNERSYERKVKEAILAFRLESALSKDRLLELYLNQIYLGSGSYGVGAAALYYFNKSLDELTIPEAAYLAALPKAPENYNPIKQPDAARERRDWVIDRMAETGAITTDQSTLAKTAPLKMVAREDDVVTAPYFAEEIRRELQERFGDNALYQGGLSVRSSIDPRLQRVAENALRQGLMLYDMKHGWRGPVAHLDSSTTDWATGLADVRGPDAMLPTWRLATVRELGPDRVRISFADITKGTILFDDMKWARPVDTEAEITLPSQALRLGDVILVEPKTDTKDQYLLRQIPKIQGAIVAIDPHTGRVLAMQGGWAFDQSEFNRVTQAWRQPGSAFKPFIYLAALDHGFTPASLVLDGPITFTDAVGRIWQPENYSGQYYGPSTLRVGIEKSRNLMTVRLADKLGMDMVVDYAKRFGVVDKMEPHLANALGSTETTLLRMTAGYGMIVNGGKKIQAQFIDRIQDRRGNTVYKFDLRGCDPCGPRVRWDNQIVPDLPDNREQIEDPRSAYQMVSILEGVVQRGTAMKLADIGRPVAGKTGTTNDSRDAWFVGFTPDLVAGVYVGFDKPQSLGDKETGGSLAVPIFRDFIVGATEGTPAVPFRVPPGIRQVMVDAVNGRRANFGDDHAIWEAFVEGTELSEGGSPDVLGSTAETRTNDEIGNTAYRDPQTYPAATHVVPQRGSVTAQPPSQQPAQDDDSESGSGTGGIY